MTSNFKNDPGKELQAEIKFKEGLALHQKGQLAQAQTIFEQVLRLQPNHFDALHALGLISCQMTNLTQGVELIGKAIAINPGNASAYCNHGAALDALKQHQAAIASYDKAIAIKPGFIDAHFNRGIALYNLKQYQAAIASYDKAIAIKPDFADAYFNRGIALNNLKQYQAAITSFDKAIAIKPNHAAAYANRGDALNGMKHHQAAIASYDQAISFSPDFAAAFDHRSVALIDMQQYQAAIDSCNKAIAINPDYAEAYFNRGNALSDLKQYQAAIDSYDKAIAIKPDYVEAYDHCGIAWNELKQHQTAIERYNKAIAIQPDCAEAYANLGKALSELKQHQAAIDSYDRAIAIQPDCAEAYSNRGNALIEFKLHQAAIASYDKAIAIKPDIAFLYGMRLHTKMHICDWNDAENQVTELMDRIQRNEKAAPSFTVLALTSSLPLQRKAAELEGNEKHPGNSELGSIPKNEKRKKIRIGYFSMDFRNHPVSHLTAELFETHDRDKFEVYAFSFGPDTKDEMQLRLERTFDEFIDVRNKSDKEIAEIARTMKIDIAIDLAGYTSNSRTGIFSMRAAPIQVSYLGYPGTMGVDYIDYIVADKQLIHENEKFYYSEKIIYLPCFQANDRKREISDKVFNREELGLPESGFTFCCFNNNYKITPGTFDGWMRILKRVDGSVLFLYAENELASNNLAMEAAKRGVNKNRLIFGGKLPASEYLARYRVADLFLDTLPFNAGTTASDALWAGLPLLTCPGESFASRMAASLLTAIDLPELIATSQEDYEARAVELATNPERLKAIKQKLARNRLTTPLFDTRLFTKHIEDAYTQMHERHHADLPPEHIYIAT